MLNNFDFIYTYPTLIPGILRKRYKRFFADIELESGEIVVAHCPNTGPMTGVCEIGNPVYISKTDNPKRTLAYTWEMIQINQTWVGINTALPNRVIKLALTQQLLPEFPEKYLKIQPEFPYGKDKKSRIDFLILSETDPLPMYLEIKNTTLTDGNTALFPDTVTSRGQKHLRELINLLTFAKPMMLYFINRADCIYFAPGDAFDPLYGHLFREAMEKGVKMLPLRFEISPQGIRYLGLAEMKI